MDKFVVARAPFPVGEETIPDAGIPLKDPYIQDDDAIIEAAKDFTVSITTISASLVNKYLSYYKADENYERYRNNYFALLSSVGLGDQDKPTQKIHFLEHKDRVTRDVDSLYAENVVTVEDYQSNEKKERLYLAFHGFCQNLESTPLDKFSAALSEVGKIAGSKFLGIIPFVSIGKIVLDGVNNLTNKLSKIPQEVKTIEFNLYPATEDRSPYPGDAPLQTGAYVLFFEPADIQGLRLSRSGIVMSDTGQEIPPYIVVNIKAEMVLSPEQLNTSAALEVMEKFKAGPGEFELKRGDGNPGYFDALAELGKSYRLAEQTQRFFSLKQKGTARTKAEEAKFIELAAVMQDYFDDWDGIFVPTVPQGIPSAELQPVSV